jgi:hypothetical protein
LGNAGPQIQRQIQQYLITACFGEEIVDAINGLIGIVRMQGGKTPMAGFSKRSGHVPSFPAR